VGLIDSASVGLDVGLAEYVGLVDGISDDISVVLDIGLADNVGLTGGDEIGSAK